MPELSDRILQLLLEQGLSGLVMLGLAWTCRKLYLRNETLVQTQLDFGMNAVKVQETLIAALNKLTETVERKDK